MIMRAIAVPLGEAAEPSCSSAAFGEPSPFPDVTGCVPVWSPAPSEPGPSETRPSVTSRTPKLVAALTAYDDLILCALARS